MAKLVFELNQSLDGYVDHLKLGPPRPGLFRHFIGRVRGLTGMVYGRRMYETMSYWDKDQSDWDAQEKEYAAAWRSKPKWVVSRSLQSVGPNATLVGKDVEAELRGLKARLAGEIEVAGPNLVGKLQLTPALSMNSESTSTLSFLVVASPTSRAAGRRFGL